MSAKLTPGSVGPCTVTERVSKVADRLALLAQLAVDSCRHTAKWAGAATYAFLSAWSVGMQC